MTDMSEKTALQILDELYEMVRTIPNGRLPGALNDFETLSVQLSFEAYLRLISWPMPPALDMWRIDLPASHFE